MFLVSIWKIPFWGRQRPEVPNNRSQLSPRSRGSQPAAKDLNLANTSVSPSPKKLKQQDADFEASLGYMASLSVRI